MCFNFFDVILCLWAVLAINFGALSQDSKTKETRAIAFFTGTEYSDIFHWFQSISIVSSLNMVPLPLCVEAKKSVIYLYIFPNGLA